MNKSSKKIVSIIPVSPFEPLSVIKKSIGSLKNMEKPEEYETEFHYVVDTEDIENDERVNFLENLNDEEVKYMIREPGEGKRAGAINDLLEAIDTPKYVGLFDVDSRPSSNFLVTSLENFPEDVFMVTSTREIINPDQNFITHMVDAEYRFLSDVQILLDQNSGFNHFNGLIGLLDGRFLMNNKLDTEKMCEDTDFSTRAYMNGKRIHVNRKSSVKEQAVTNFEDLYSQKERWMNAPWENLEEFVGPMLSSKTDPKIKLSWISAMILPLFSALFSFFSPLYGLRMLLSKEKTNKVLEKVVGLFAISWLISYCYVVAGFKRATGGEVKWTASEREDV